MLLTDFDYIGETEADIPSCLNHVAMEAAVRAIEDDESIPRYHLSQIIDLRSYAHLESVSRLRDLIRDPSFKLDLFMDRQPDRKEVFYRTLFNRSCKRGFATDHHLIQTSKGLLALDYLVAVTTHTDPQAKA